MADPIHSIKQGSIKPDLVATLKDAENRAVDLTNAVSVSLQVAPLGEDEITIAGEFVGDRTAGTVKCPMSAELAAIPGTHKAAIVVDWGSSEGTEGFPNPADLWVRVHRDNRAAS